MKQFTLYRPDENGREINVSMYSGVGSVGQEHYPGVRLYAYGDYKEIPVAERIMSLPDVPARKIGSPTGYSKIEYTPVFFFVYNVDNYYHFVYDTLPYLISYQYLKGVVPGIKLLINLANAQQTKLNAFVTEFLELLSIRKDDLLFFNNDTVYHEFYVSSSYTHDGKSNLPPRQEIYSLYNGLVDQVAVDNNLPKKIYVSRRSYKHGDYSNIGTNYTARRSLANEDELVNLLESKGYTEVFTELLDTKTKIAMFKGCTHVVGAIGGGLCNVLFSSPQTKLTAIVSPHFLEINKRFLYSFANVNVEYFTDTQHIETSEHKRYMRVRIKQSGVIGEIVFMHPASPIMCVAYSDEAVAGWNAQVTYKTTMVRKDEVQIIDPGLNAAWQMDLDKFMETVNV